MNPDLDVSRAQWATGSTDDPDRLRKYYLGSQCQLAQDLSSWTVAKDLDLADALKTLASQKQLGTLIYADDDHTERIRIALEALSSLAIMASCLGSNRHGGTPQILDEFKKATSGLDALLSDDNSESVTADKAICDLPAFQWSEFVSGLDVSAKQTTWGAIWCCLRRWSGEETAGASNQFQSRCAVTPVILVRQGGSWVPWLRVELFPLTQGNRHGGGPFSPDLCVMGLMDFVDNGGFLKSLHDAWKLSGLSSRFAARWSLLTTNDQLLEPQQLPLSATRLDQLPVLEGPSAQAAALVALLAASGNCYGRELHSAGELLPAERLDPSVAITATVDGLSLNVPVQHRKLGKVGSLPGKLETLVRWGARVLFSLYVSDEQLDDKSGEKLRNLKEQYARRLATMQTGSADSQKGKTADESLLPLEVDSVNTVEQALDALLLTNQHLRKWHAFVQAKWEGKWRPGTADLQTLLATSKKVQTPPSDG